MWKNLNCSADSPNFTFLIILACLRLVQWDEMSVQTGRFDRWTNYLTSNENKEERKSHTIHLLILACNVHCLADVQLQLEFFESATIFFYI